MDEHLLGITVGNGPAGGLHVPLMVADDFSQGAQVGLAAAAGKGPFQRCSAGRAPLGQVGIFVSVHGFSVHRSGFAFIRYGLLQIK